MDSTGNCTRTAQRAETGVITAVEPNHRRRGIGGGILDAILEHVRAHGGGMTWCHARIDARSLYERSGFVAADDPFEDPIAGRQVLLVRQGDSA